MDVPSPVIPGDYLSLTCDVDNQGNRKIYWLTPNGSKKNADKGALRQKATSQDNGEWTCVVEANDDKKKYPFKIFVSVVGELLGENTLFYVAALYLHFVLHLIFYPFSMSQISPLHQNISIHLQNSLLTCLFWSLLTSLCNKYHPKSRRLCGSTIRKHL